MMKRLHDMPFGATVLRSGGTRFRLWAPAVETVTLVLDPGEDEHRIDLHTDDDGWVEYVAPKCEPATRYLYQIGEQRVPDPASRQQAGDVHGASVVVDPSAFHWQDDDWQGRPWHEAVVYELHVGTFSPSGDYEGIAERLDHLVKLGVTAIELMPVNAFDGARNWGYDGVLPFAPANAYGPPESLKRLVQAAHTRGLMVFMDVVYNHFGPSGNYLHLYAPQFFTERHHTPWGAAINFDGEHSHWVRQFFIHNALYWLREYSIDGLRLDAVHAIIDDSEPNILDELAAAVEQRFDTNRQQHLVLENDRNQAHYLRPTRSGGYRAQWNDDIHHALHVLLTGEHGGYYIDYSVDPLAHLERCLAEGFAYQGEPSVYRDGKRRGEPSTSLPPQAFVSFLQNHDQIGNRAFGERITALADERPVTAVISALLLAPFPPLLFMGQEWGADEPFLYFCDHHGDLARAVTEGRRREFARFPEFADESTRESIPDPNARETFERTRLDWEKLDEPAHERWLTLHRDLLTLRAQSIVPRLETPETTVVIGRRLKDQLLTLRWRLGDGSLLDLVANLGDAPAVVTDLPGSRLLHCSDPEFAWPVTAPEPTTAPGWTTVWFLDEVTR